MDILLDDIPFNNSLYPFTALKSIAHIRVGILTIYEKWQMAFPGNVFLSSQLTENKASYIDYLKIPANLIPSSNFLERIHVTGSEALALGDHKTLKFPWEIFQYNDWALRQDFEMITSGRDSEEISYGNKVVSVENIFVEPGAAINFSILNAREGPIYIAKNAEILEGCMIRGQLWLGEGSKLRMRKKVYTTTTIGTV